MATESYPEEDEDILHCCMCRNILEDAKLLDCLHRCCRKCLIGVIGAVAPGDGSFQCPSCHHEQKLTDNGVDGIPTDYFLKEILRIKKLEKDLKNNNEERTCSSCEKLSTVFAICSHCCGFLCKGCYSSHSLMRVFKSHVHIATLEDIEAGRTTFDVHSVSYSANSTCPTHNDMTMNINCQTCEEQICSLCVPSSHQTHQLEEIDEAGKRIKEKITELVEESKQKETALEEQNKEITELREKYKSIIAGILEQAEAEQMRAEKSIKDKKEKDLKYLEDQRKRIEQSAQKKLEQIRREKKFINDEAELFKAFVLHFFGDVETETQKIIRTVKDRQKMAKILTTDGNNWSLLRAIKEIENTLTFGGDEKNSAIKACRNAVPKLSTLSTSAMNEICWKKQTDKLIGGLLIPEDFSVISLVSDVRRNNKDNILSVATIRSQVSLSEENGQVSIIMVDCDKLKRDSTYTLELSGAKHVLVVGSEGSVYTVIVKSNGSSLYCNGEHRGDFNLPNTVLCCTELPSKEGFLVSVEGSADLYKCNYEAMQISSMSIEEADLQPPVTLSVASDVTIVLGDGKSKALAVNDQGAVKHRFQRRHFTDRPVRVAIDRHGFIYVLWNSWEQGYSCVVMQYSPKGTVISEIHVPHQTTSMTAMVIRDCDTIVLGRSWAPIEFYEKTPVGEMLGQYVLHTEDPSRYQSLSVWLSERRKVISTQSDGSDLGGPKEHPGIISQRMLSVTDTPTASGERLLTSDIEVIFEDGQGDPELIKVTGGIRAISGSVYSVAPVREHPETIRTVKVDGLPLADQFRPPAGSWNCDTCFVNNPLDKMECLACATSKPGATKPSITDIKFTSSRRTGLFSSIAPEPFAFHAPSGFPSTLSASSRIVKITPSFTRSGSPKPSFKSSSKCGFKMPVGDSFGAPTSEKPAEPKVSETTKASTNVFGFTTPGVNNNSNSDTTKAVADSTVEDPTLGKATGPTATEQPAGQRLTFGGGMTQFSFGSHSQGKSASVASERKPVGLACGGSPSSNKTQSTFQGFSFSQKPAENASSFAGNSQFSFRLDIDTVTASTPKPREGKPQVKSPRNERDDLHFKSKLADTVVLETGEENEEVNFTHRAKLYRFDVAGRQWKERGVGDIKVLYNPKTEKHRIVMRREQVLNVCANHFINKLVDLKPNAGSGRSWVWHAMDASDGEVRNEQLAVKFSTEEAAKEFKEAVDEAKKTI